MEVLCEDDALQAIPAKLGPSSPRTGLLVRDAGQAPKQFPRARSALRDFERPGPNSDN